jgi:hypothetical protein
MVKKSVTKDAGVNTEKIVWMTDGEKRMKLEKLLQSSESMIENSMCSKVYIYDDLFKL